LPDDEATHRPAGLTSYQSAWRRRRADQDVDIPHILTFLLVLSPLFIPIGVSVVHAIRTRPRLPVLAPATARQRRRLELAVEFD
jgi:hypothetical protein